MYGIKGFMHSCIASVDILPWMKTNAHAGFSTKTKNKSISNFQVETEKHEKVY